MENVGGQAVIEGVMIRTGSTVVTAVRKPNKKIVYKKEKIKSITQKNKFLGLPLIRGIIILFEILIVGIKTLNYSANQAITTGKSEKKLSAVSIAASLSIAVVIALIIFKLVPLLIVQCLKNNLKTFGNRLLFNLVEGFIKILLLVGYIYAISFFKDINRLFMYHGAEHKAVHCYEAGEKLSVNNAKKYSPIHARCGTSFILLVLVISILCYVLIPLDLSFSAKYVLRVMLLPVIGGISYEVLKINAKHPKCVLLKILTFPGVLLQRLTTKEPKNDQLEVALFALKKAIA